MTADPDNALMQQLSAGEDSALNRLMSRWQGPLLSYLYRYTGNQDDALDLAQETFVRVYENRHRYEPRGKFSSWLFTIAANLSRNHARWQERHPTVSLYATTVPEEDSNAAEEGLEGQLASPDPTPSDNADREDLASAVREHIQRLPHDLRTAVLLSEYEDFSHAEIARTLGCTPKAVETRLYRARDVLRKALAAWKQR